MTATVWTPPLWTTQAPPGVSFAEEVELLRGFVEDGERVGFRVVPEAELDFDTRNFADLVLERPDGARLMFALSEKGPHSRSRVDVNARPRPRHVELRRSGEDWQVLTDSDIPYPVPLAKLRLPGLAELMLRPWT